MFNRRLGLTALGAVVFALLSGASPEAARSKYGPEATRMASSHDYLRSHEAPDFWAMIPYYLPQQDDRSCSVASVTMLVNAARAKESLHASDALATQASILKKVHDDEWTRDVGPGGHGVSLDLLGRIIRESLKDYGFDHAHVEVVHLEKDDAAARKQVASVLSANEKTARNFLVINFLQSAFTGDPEGAVGHIAPVAAYDAAHSRVLILDPDREWYEPYWVSVDTLLKGMATRDSESAKARGYVFVTLE